jgi:catechol 2,3-dioxygenase-like lactoylglutathione lyase family enzyme
LRGVDPDGSSRSQEADGTDGPAVGWWKNTEMSADLFHVGLTVADLERSVEFYRDTAGMDVLSVVDLDSGAFGRLTDNPGARLRTALLGLGAFHLQLVQYTAGGGPSLDVDHRYPGAPHLSFWVADLDSLYDRLDGLAGVTVTSDRVEVVPGIRSFYVADPDGVPVEFIERTEWDAGREHGRSRAAAERAGRTGSP